ncbi:MAG: bacillithiol biosynthesis cysteine-adding enzyme BshC, partial [Ignavibacteriales bacterium]
MFINFSDIPGHQNLFLDYLYEFDNVRRFYPKDFRDSKNYFEHFAKLEKREKPHLASLKQIISKQYNDFNPGPKTIDNINSLVLNNTFAIVTGQQLGIFGGPLYTFYKIITAIELAHLFNEKYDSYHFVPVFWLEGDDHDFDEVRSFNLLDENNEIVKISYDDGITEEINRGSVGNISFNGNINNVTEQLTKILRDNEFKPKIMEMLSGYYKEGTTFKESFKKLIFDLFDEYGLIIFDPSDANIKSILKPIFIKEIEEQKEHSTELVKISAELEEVYHAQVKVRPINLFMSEDDGRYLIEPVENEFRLRGKRKRLSKETIFEQIENTPEKFSPNVLLRPVCQDYIFKTACYIGGPSEISYFAQVIPLYKYFNVDVPIIYPRSSVTIVEKNIQKILEKFNLNYTDFISENETIAETVINNLAEIDLAESFRKATYDVNLIIDELREKL